MECLRKNRKTQNFLSPLDILIKRQADSVVQEAEQQQHLRSDERPPKRSTNPYCLAGRNRGTCTFFNVSSKASSPFNLTEVPYIAGTGV